MQSLSVSQPALVADKTSELARPANRYLRRPLFRGNAAQRRRLLHWNQRQSAIFRSFQSDGRSFVGKATADDRVRGMPKSLTDQTRRMASLGYSSAQTVERPIPDLDPLCVVRSPQHFVINGQMRIAR